MVGTKLKDVLHRNYLTYSDNKKELLTIFCVCVRMLWKYSVVGEWKDPCAPIADGTPYCLASNKTKPLADVTFLLSKEHFFISLLDFRQIFEFLAFHIYFLCSGCFCEPVQNSFAVGTVSKDIIYSLMEIPILRRISI